MNVSMENNKNGYKWITKLFREGKVVGKTFSVRRLLSVKKKRSQRKMIFSNQIVKIIIFVSRPDLHETWNTKKNTGGWKE